ncbi:hypothetical protein H0H92_009275, partial [Tricholoma furcatifolium]
MPISNPAMSHQGPATSPPPPSTCHLTHSRRRTPTRPTTPQPPPAVHPTSTTPLSTHKHANNHLPHQQAPPHACQLDNYPHIMAGYY